MFSAPRRRGLTRLESLVVVSLGILALGLLAPALQQARAAGRGAACRLNLASIALAAHNYHDTYGFFPPGMDNQYVGTLVFLLPFVEQDLLYRNFSFSSTYPLYWLNPHNRPPTDGTDRVPRPPAIYGCEGEVLTYLCPDGPQIGRTATALLAVRYGTPGVDYRANDGLGDAHYFSGSPGRLIMARSHYLGIGGDYRTEPPYNGLFRGIFTYNSRTRLASVTDGSSNTAMFAEMWGGHFDWAADVGVPSGWIMPSRSAGFNWSAFGTCPDPANGNCNYSRAGFGLSLGAFGALHGNGRDRFHVAMGDGSVRQFPGDFDFGLWTLLCGMNDGLIVPPPGLEPTAAWPWLD